MDGKIILEDIVRWFLIFLLVMRSGVDVFFSVIEELVVCDDVMMNEDVIDGVCVVCDLYMFIVCEYYLLLFYGMVSVAYALGLDFSRVLSRDTL